MKNVSPAAGDFAPELFDLAEEIFVGNIGVAERAFESVPVDFAVIGKHDPPTVGMFEFDMTAASVNLHESQPLQCRSALAGRSAVAVSRQLHDLVLLISQDLAGRWLQIQRDRLAQVLERLVAGLPVC